MRAHDLLLTATDVINQRARIYGHAEINQGRIAARLSNLFNVPIEDYEACLALVEVKLSRIQETKDHLDSYLDAICYLALAYELTQKESDLYV